MKASFPRVLGAALAPAMFSLIAIPAANAEPFAYVAPGDIGTHVAVIDTATNTQIALVQVGLHPFDVAITPNGDFAYVANYHGGEFSSSDPDTVSVIDTSTNTVVATLGVGIESNPSAIAITPDGAFAYVTRDAFDDIAVIDTASNTIIANIPVSSISLVRGIAITPDGAFAYVATGDTISVIDTASNTVTEVLDIGSPPGGIAITPDGAFAYVATGSTISLLDIATNTVVATVPLNARAIAITPDGAFAYTASGFNPDSRVGVIDTATNIVVATVPIESGALDIAITPDGAFAYVAHFESNAGLTVIETATNTVTATLRTVDGFAIAITPEPQAIEVRVDILPADKKNRINLRSNGNIAVAVLSTRKFDATQVDWETVTFGPRDATELHRRSHVRDVDRDGDMDFVLHFKIRKTGIKCGDRKAKLTGETFSGQVFTGSDKVKPRNCR